MSPSLSDITIPEFPAKAVTSVPPSDLEVQTPLESPSSPGCSELKINCVVVGDENVGKSRLVNTYIAPGSEFQSNYEPTTADEYTVETELMDGFGRQNKVLLHIVDTGGQKELDRLRPLCYNEANVFILCFSVVVPSSFQSLMTKWLPEIKRHVDPQKISLFLIGTQSDLRSNTTVLLKLSKDGKSPVSESRAIRLGGKIGAKNYIECSALTKKNVRQIFDYVMINSCRNVDDENFIKNPPSGTHRPIGIQRSLSFDKENRAYVGKKGRQLLRQMLSKQWNTRKCYKMKRLVLFSCLFN